MLLLKIVFIYKGEINIILEVTNILSTKNGYFYPSWKESQTNPHFSTFHGKLCMLLWENEKINNSFMKFNWSCFIIIHTNVG